MSNVIDKINKTKPDTEVLKDKRNHLVDERLDKIDATTQEALKPIIAQIGLDKLIDAGIKVIIGKWCTITIEGEGTYLEISYNSWGSEGKESFDHKYINIDLSSTGYGWRQSANDTIESRSKDFNKYLKAAKDLELIVSWAADKDFNNILKTIWSINRKVRESLKDFNKAEIDTIDKSIEEYLNEHTEEIFNSISEGDSLKGIVKSKTYNLTNGYNRKYIASSIPLFEKFTRKGEYLRVLHTFPDEQWVHATNQSFKTTDVKERIKELIWNI